MLIGLDNPINLVEWSKEGGGGSSVCLRVGGDSYA